MSSTSSKSSKSKPSLDLFMILGNILVDKNSQIYERHIGHELFTSVFSSYMVLRYLTMNSDPGVRNAVLNNLTTLERLSDKPVLLYRLLLEIVPKTYGRFTPYIRSGFIAKKDAE